MKKKVLLAMMTLAISTAMFTGGSVGNAVVFAEDSVSETTVGTKPAPYTGEGAVTIEAADAVFSEGSSVNAANEEQETYYDEENHLISCLGDNGTVTYTVPDGVEGEYDLYLTVSKVMAQYSSQFFTFQINNGEVFSVPTEVEVSGDSEFRFTKDGDDYNTGVLTDSARFPILSNVSLKAGDTVTVTAAFAARSPKLKGKTYPSVGDLLIAPAGSEVPVGYEDTVKELAEADETDALSGKNIIWIGSSVTYGAHAAGHYSMVDEIANLHKGTICEKYAISATTLVNGDISSYVSRLKMIPQNKTPDMIVVQLSTNDATTGKEFGEISESENIADFDDTTIAGAIETMIAYAKDTFDCPVVFYTGSYCEKENYKEMVDLLLKIQEKWGIGVIDMFNNEEMTAIYGSDQYNDYMSDEVHPTRQGYIEWWTPVIDSYLTQYAEENL